MSKVIQVRWDIHNNEDGNGWMVTLVPTIDLWGCDGTYCLSIRFLRCCASFWLVDTEELPL